MAEGIYYYDETAPLTHSHDNVLRYQRPDQTPATYLVELPGDLPEPPSRHGARAGTGRRGASIVQMDRQTSETEHKELDPLEAYVRTNLPCFRKSLAPEDLRDGRRAERSALVDCKLEEIRCTPAVVESVSEDCRKTQNGKPLDNEVRQTPPDISSVDMELLMMGQDENPSEMEEISTPGLASSSNKEVGSIGPNSTQPTKRVRKAPLNAIQKYSEIRKAPSDKTSKNEIRTLALKETPGRNKVQKLLEHGEKVQKNNPNKVIAVNKTLNAPPNIISENEEIRTPLGKSLIRNKMRQESVNDDSVKDNSVKNSRKNSTVIETTVDKRARKEQKNTSSYTRSLNNEIRTHKQVIKEKERNRANPTAMPILTDPGGPENDWKPRWDSFYNGRYCCLAKKRGPLYDGDMDIRARPFCRKLINYTDISDGRTPDRLYDSHLNGKGRKVTKQELTFEESRLKVDIMVELLHDSRFVNLRHPIHNNFDHTVPRINENTKELEEGCNRTGRVQQRLDRRSWSANSGRESIDKSHEFKDQSFNTHDEDEFPDLSKVGKGRLRGGANANRRSRSASFMRMSQIFKDSRCVEKKCLADDSNSEVTKNNEERKEPTCNKENVNNFLRRNSLAESFKLDDVKNYNGRVCGGYDGKQKDQPSTKVKTNKPFNYDGMINCNIEDCPCRCHPDYDHTSGERPGTARVKDSPDRSRGKGYDPLLDSGLGSKDKPGDARYRDYPDGAKGKDFDTRYDGDPNGRRRPEDERSRNYPGKGYDPVGKGRPEEGRDRGYPVKGYDPDGKGRLEEGRDRGYPVKVNDPYYSGDLNDKGRARDGKGREHPAKGYDRRYNGDRDGKGGPRSGRGRGYPRKGYEPYYDDDLSGKGRTGDERDSGYTDSPARKGYDAHYDGDLDRKGRARDGKDQSYRGKGYDPLFDGFDDKAKPRVYRDGAPLGKSVGVRPGDNSPLRGDPTQGDGRNVRGVKDGGGRSVLKQRVPKTATSLFTYKRYHIQIPDHDLKDPWFNARFSINKDKDVDLKYQGPVKINNYYTSNRYE